MFEHVDLANLPAYFATVRRVLRPGGLFLNHGITHDEEGWNKTVASDPARLPLTRRGLYPAVHGQAASHQHDPTGLHAIERSID